jgi:hypothetical protein
MMENRLILFFARIGEIVLALFVAIAEMFLLDLVLDGLLYVWNLSKGRIRGIRWDTLETDVFWLGTALGFLAGFVLIPVWPEGLAIFGAFLLGMLKGHGAA